jgi:hypothetical protein
MARTRHPGVQIAISQTDPLDATAVAITWERRELSTREYVRDPADSSSRRYWHATILVPKPLRCWSVDDVHAFARLVLRMIEPWARTYRLTLSSVEGGRLYVSSRDATAWLDDRALLPHATLAHLWRGACGLTLSSDDPTTVAAVVSRVPVDVLHQAKLRSFEVPGVHERRGGQQRRKSSNGPPYWPPSPDDDLDTDHDEEREQ